MSIGGGIVLLKLTMAFCYRQTIIKLINETTFGARRFTKKENFNRRWLKKIIE